MSITTRIENGVFTIIFDRIERKNAITASMYEDIAHHLLAADRNSAVRVILIQGHTEIFTAGNDLEDFMDRPPGVRDELGTYSAPFQFLHALHKASKPVVAAVSGPAVGVGATMLLHCDLVYASDTAVFTMPFVQLGLCPEAASSILLPRLMGHQRAAEKLMFGEPFDAREAYDLGLVTKVMPVDELAHYVRKRVHKLASLPANSLRETKRLLKEDSASLVARRMDEEGYVFERLLLAPEAKEAFTAFFEKRKPDFSKLAEPLHLKMQAKE